MLNIIPAYSGASDIPPYINFQGVLFDSQGLHAQGPVDLGVGIYDDPTAGTVKYYEFHSNVTLINGVYNLLLGSGSLQEPVGGFADGITGAAERWIQITVNGEVLQPRLVLTSVAFSLVAGRAVVAESLQGLSEAPSQLVTLSNLSSAFSTQVPLLGESQIPPSIARLADLATEAQVRATADNVLQNSIEDIGFRISALETSLATKLSFNETRVDVGPLTMRSIRANCPDTSTPLTADFQTNADSQQVLYSSKAFAGNGEGPSGWQIDYGNTGMTSHAVRLTVICLQ